MGVMLKNQRYFMFRDHPHPTLPHQKGEGFVSYGKQMGCPPEPAPLKNGAGMTVYSRFNRVLCTKERKPNRIPHKFSFASRRENFAE
jgi:hypothetical protein